MSSIPIIYGKSAPAALITCLDGVWTTSDIATLQKIFKPDKVTWDRRYGKYLVLISGPVKVSEARKANSEFFSTIAQRAERQSGGEYVFYGPLSEIRQELPFTPSFAHWPELKAEKPRVMTGTLRDYRR